MEETPDCLLYTGCFFLQKQSSEDSDRNILDTVDGGTLVAVYYIFQFQRPKQEVKEKSPPQLNEYLLETESHITIWTHQFCKCEFHEDFVVTDLSECDLG